MSEQAQQTNMINVDLTVAYQKACQTIGETTIEKGLLLDEINRLIDENNQLRQALVTMQPPSPSGYTVRERSDFEYPDDLDSAQADSLVTGPLVADDES